MFWDYTAREGNALLTDWKISKEDYKKMVEKYTYKTFEEAYKNLPVLPAPSEVDTREKMTQYSAGELKARVEAVKTQRGSLLIMLLITHYFGALL